MEDMLVHNTAGTPSTSIFQTDLTFTPSTWYLELVRTMLKVWVVVLFSLALVTSLNSIISLTCDPGLYSLNLVFPVGSQFPSIGQHGDVIRRIWNMRLLTILTSGTDICWWILSLSLHCTLHCLARYHPLPPEPQVCPLLPDKPSWWCPPQHPPRGSRSSPLSSWPSPPEFVKKLFWMKL